MHLPSKVEATHRDDVGRWYFKAPSTVQFTRDVLFCAGFTGVAPGPLFVTLFRYHTVVELKLQVLHFVTFYGFS